MGKYVCIITILFITRHSVTSKSREPATQDLMPLGKYKLNLCQCLYFFTYVSHLNPGVLLWEINSYQRKENERAEETE